MCTVSSEAGLDWKQRLLIGMIAYPIWAILSIAITAITYFRTVIKVKKLAKAHFSKINTGIHKLLWYPVALFIVFTPSLINRFAYIIDPTSKPSLPFTIVHVALTHSIGLTNAIIYGVQKKQSDYKRSETIESLDVGNKQVDMTEF